MHKNPLVFDWLGPARVGRMNAYYCFTLQIYHISPALLGNLPFEFLLWERYLAMALFPRLNCYAQFNGNEG
jgi:hypothetical protein